MRRFHVIRFRFSQPPQRPLFATQRSFRFFLSLSLFRQKLFSFARRVSLFRRATAQAAFLLAAAFAHNMDSQPSR
jgi:hypothetical protein